AYWEGHGSPTGIYFSGCSSIDDTHLSNTDARWGQGDVEWVSWLACSTLDLGTSGNFWCQRWGGAFDALHQINGYANTAYDSTSHGTAFADYMVRTPFLWWNNPMKVREAWAQASIDSQPGGVTWATMGPIGSGGWVTYNDFFWGHGSVGPDLPASLVTG